MAGTIIAFNSTQDTHYKFFVFKEFCPGDCVAGTVVEVYLKQFSNPVMEPEQYNTNNSLVLD